MPDRFAARAIGITSMELAALALAVWAYRDDLATCYPLLSLLRRFASESEGGIVGDILSRLAAQCRHDYRDGTDADDPPPALEGIAVWCARCGHWTIDAPRGGNGTVPDVPHDPEE